MDILADKTARRKTNTISMIINNYNFFDMNKSKAKNPVFQEWDEK